MSPRKSNPWLDDDRWTNNPPADGEVPTYRTDKGRWIYEPPTATGSGTPPHTILDGGAAHTDSGLGDPTKGDLIAGDGTKWDDLPAGADGTVLSADSTQSQGLSWIPPSNITGIIAYAIRKGLAANRPETGISGGDVWFSTDTSQLFIRTEQ